MDMGISVSKTEDHVWQSMGIKHPYLVDVAGREGYFNPSPAGSLRRAAVSHCSSAELSWGTAAQNINTFLRFISTPSHSFEIPAIREES